MTTACCGLLLSAVHNAASATPQKLLPLSLICFTLRLFDTLFFLAPYFPLILFFPFQCFALYGLSHALFHLRLVFLCLCLLLSIPLLHHSFMLGGMLHRSLWTTSITTMTSHQGASYDFVLIACCLTFKGTHFHQDGHYIYVIRGWLCCCCCNWWWWWQPWVKQN